MPEETPQEQIPEPQDTLPEQGANPYDTSSEQQEYDALQNEIAQAQESLESDLAIDIAHKITPELEELFFEDKEQFLREVFKMQNEFLETKIKPKQDRANELGTSIEKKQTMQSIEAAQNQFIQNHPDVNIDELMSFFMQLPEDVQAELSALPPQHFFEALLQIFNNKDMQQAQDNAEQGLPTQINGVGNNSAMSESGNDMPMERF